MNENEIDKLMQILAVTMIVASMFLMGWLYVRYGNNPKPDLHDGKIGWHYLLN